MSRTLRKMFDGALRIAIPMIQRDYAHGRDSAVEVRERFLSALQEALDRPGGDPYEPLDLDFVYGSRAAAGEFAPLDGQQRLTTLFLLHWYLALRDGEIDDFRSWACFPGLGEAQRPAAAFSYEVRPSSRDFFDRIVGANIDLDDLLAPGDGESGPLSRTIRDQHWFFRSWLRDPTIQSCLAVLDAIHQRFGSSSGHYRRLVDPEEPAITFQFLDLQELGLTDDLYIKMNARGKPLTEFETFKASFQKHVHDVLGASTRQLATDAGSTAVPTSLYVANRFDTAWCDLFWEYRGVATNADQQTMNAIRGVALLNWPTVASARAEKEVLETLEQLRAAEVTTYYDFFESDCLGPEFIGRLIDLFDRWSSDPGAPGRNLQDTRYYDEVGAFRRVVQRGHLGPRSGLAYSEWVQFLAWSRYLLTDLPLEGLADWMRLVVNLSENTIFNRTREFRAALDGMGALLGASGDGLLKYLAEGGTVDGFNKQQVQEERLKAQLILRNQEWRTLIEAAETHAYFRGQIEFLLEFSGVLALWLKDDPICPWDDQEDAVFRQQFLLATRRARTMFHEGDPQDGSRPGLRALDGYLWERALLCEGNYLLSNRLNHGLLVDSDRDLSWKRLLRADLRDKTLQAKRALLGRLFDHVDPEDVEASLLARIEQGVGDDPTDDLGLPGWRERLVEDPSLIKYCRRHRLLRVVPGHSIYLLSKKRRNGRHLALFTKHLEGRVQSLLDDGLLKPFSHALCDEVMTDTEETWLTVTGAGQPVYVEYSEGAFQLMAPVALADEDGTRRWTVAPDDIEGRLVELAERARR